MQDEMVLAGDGVSVLEPGGRGCNENATQVSDDGPGSLRLIEWGSDDESM